MVVHILKIKDFVDQEQNANQFSNVVLGSGAESNTSMRFSTRCQHEEIIIKRHQNSMMLISIPKLIQVCRATAIHLLCSQHINAAST